MLIVFALTAGAVYISDVAALTSQRATQQCNPLQALVMVKKFQQASSAASTNVMPPPRDPELAVREEFALAVARNSPEALAQFIERHADHPLAAEARRLLEAMQGKQ
jgi:hypothetical protein